jgi:8-oxo-dGTP pyrophosphatase MutT (NUDIX family)
MSIPSLIASLEQHIQDFPFEKSYTDQTIDWINEYGDFAFVKNNMRGHITGSMLITNTERTKVLLMFHKKLQFWVQFGGHCDGEIDVLAVAIREFHEESGIEIEPVVSDGIFDIHVHYIPVDAKWTPPHIHHDILYLATIPEHTPFVRQESEIDDIRWFDIEWIEKYIAEERMLYMMDKIKQLRNA